MPPLHPSRATLGAQLRPGFPYHSSDNYILDRKKPCMARLCRAGYSFENFGKVDEWGPHVNEFLDNRQLSPVAVSMLYL